MTLKSISFNAADDCTRDPKPTQLAPAQNANKELPQPSGQAIKPKKPQICVSQYNNTDLQSLVTEVINPYLAYFETQNVLHGVCQLLELLDMYGSCPSIVEVWRGKEPDDELRVLKNELSLVSLTSHSCRVVMNALKLLKDEYRHDHDNLVPLIVIISLAHDIGKIPSLREENHNYTMADHVVISAAKAEEIFRGIHFLPKILNAINNHHRAGGDQFSIMLRQADSNARQEEVAEISNMVSSYDWTEWFDISEFLDRIKPQINHLKSGNNKWYAFSFRGIVYARPDLLYKTVQKLAKEKNVIDMSLILPFKKKDVLIKIVDRIRQEDMLASDVAEGYFGRHYEIIWEVKKYAVNSEVKMKMYLLPVKIEVFGVPPHEIERCKNGIYLQRISQVRAAKGGQG